MRERAVYWITIAVLTLLLIKTCNKVVPECAQVQKTDTLMLVKNDTITKEVKAYVVKPIHLWRHDTIETSYVIHDTLQEANYMAEYTDTLKFEPYGFAIVTDTVNGKITSRSYSYMLTDYNTTTTVTNTVEAPQHNKLYLGGSLILPLSGFETIVGYQTKKAGTLYQLGFGAGKWGTYARIGLLLKIKP